jgi:P4 family phage/plasmid primase-like protien
MIAQNPTEVKAVGPYEYQQAGFRILPIGPDKSPHVQKGAFGKHAPTFTVDPADFRFDELPALLTGPCPAGDALEGRWLLVLDLDGDTSVNDINSWVGVDLPPTLSSKGYRHLYYWVPEYETRAAIRQWVRVFGRAEGAPELDIKWDGGYAIEPPGRWDGAGFEPERIADLPEAWIKAVLALRNANPYAGPQAGTPRESAGSARVDMGDVPQDVIDALAPCWPRPGEGCHEAALALGGILADSFWDEEDIARFAGALFLAVGSKDRRSDVLHSVATKRSGGECKGWPSLKACLKDAARGDFNAALAVLKKGVPGLSAPKVNVPQITDQGKVAVAPAKQGLKLTIGSDDEIAVEVVKEHLADAVYDEGALWRYQSDRGVWCKVEPYVLSKLIEVYDGVVYDVTERGKPIWVKLGQGRVSSIQRRIETKLERPSFFAEAPIGLAFRNGFLTLPDRKFGPLAPEHRARHVLPCDFGLDAARRAPPVNWVRYLRSIWGSDTQSIELVHQLLGYLLSGRHDLQKIFVLLGPPRAGKGTLLNLIQAIFREQAGPFKVASLDQTFSMQSMLGKTVVYDPDVRRASSMFKSEGQMVERLLSISSHDCQTIPRKNQTDVIASLPARVLLAANPPFGLTDVGGALASRFIILTFPHSFLGCEDIGLGARLEKEIPSIVALALDGLDRLDRVGRFIEPASSAEERESVERAQNPMLAFVEDLCELGADYSVACEELWTAAVRWRESNGHKRMSNQAFGEFLRQRGVRSVRGSRADGRARVYHGIRLIAATGPGPKLALVPDHTRPIGTARPAPAKS